MKFCISNIAWKYEEREDIYQLMNEYGFTALETAPGLIMNEHNKSPYDTDKQELIKLRKQIDQKNIKLVSLQSLLFGSSNLYLFQDKSSRENLKSYLKKAVNFASALGINNLVFGSPKNRIIPENMSPETAEEIALEFFRDAAQYALQNDTCISMEANAAEYGGNWITHTREALDLVKKVNNKGFRLNLDMGTMSLNNEPAEIIGDCIEFINHIHISEEFLNPVSQNNPNNKEEHKKRAQIIKNTGYNKFVSVEMNQSKNGNNIEAVESALKFVKETYGA